MSIPDYQSLMLPLLSLVSDGEEWTVQRATSALSESLSLTEQERNKMLPSGREPVIKNRVGWARAYLKNAGLLKQTRRGYFQITDRGIELLSQQPARIDNQLLKQFEEFNEFLSRSNDKDDPVEEVATSGSDSKTPEERMEVSYNQLRSQLATEILDQIKSCSPEFFERLVVDVLVSLGYGGSIEDAAEATQLSNDEGIDGVIKEDRLGFEKIYIQAKRWENPVHRPEVQKFAGALQGKRAKKGVFITTSTFSDGAREFGSNIESQIVFIDGNELANLMIDFGVGVTPYLSFEIKKLDSDYFNES